MSSSSPASAGACSAAWPRFPHRAVSALGLAPRLPAQAGAYLLDPTSDPLGAGYHIIQSTIAVGSGGIPGKGWLNGTQAHLEFIPERHTDFIFAVYSEEFGLIGNIVLLVLYGLLIGRGLVIAANAATLFARLMAGSVTLMFFTYAFVNMGMVSGILPVVGVPLPFLSYGGTALLRFSSAWAS